MLKELMKILENANGQAIGLFRQSDKSACIEINCSEDVINLFDTFNPAKYFKIDMTDFIGADSGKNDFWIGTDCYIIEVYS